MAINKAELSKSFNNQQKKEIDALEAMIDGRLMADYAGSPMNIAIKGLPHAKVQQEIRRRYRQAGWQIKFESDQRDGEWIELS